MTLFLISGSFGGFLISAAIREYRLGKGSLNRKIPSLKKSAPSTFEVLLAGINPKAAVMWTPPTS